MTVAAPPPIVVTGVAGGIGSAIARRLLRDGRGVVGTFRSGADKAASLAAEFPHLEIVSLDLSSVAAVEAFLKSWDRPIGGLVNNAGIVEFEDFSAYDLSLWRRTERVNVESVLQLTVGLAGCMAGPAAIVNIASTDAFLGGVDTMAYAASKAALVSLTKSLAINLGPRGIRVNAVAPGWIDTPMGTKLPRMAIEHTPLGRLGTPEDIAGVVAFLLSADAAFVTGTTLVADGGYYCLDPVMLAETKLDRV